MSDNPIKAWIEEHRAIHAAATDGPWQFTNFGVDGPEPPNPEDRFDILPVVIARTEESHEDTRAIVDAHNVTVPRALDALNAVLELHKPTESVDGYKLCSTCAEEDDCTVAMYWPCPTVQAIEGAING